MEEHRVVWLFGLALAPLTVGCAAMEVVRQASDDLHCSPDDIVLTDITPYRPRSHRRRSGTSRARAFRADGCGRHESYVCDGWDSYNQTPICHPGRPDPWRWPS